MVYNSAAKEEGGGRGRINVLYCSSVGYCVLVSLSDSMLVPSVLLLRLRSRQEGTKTGVIWTREGWRELRNPAQL